MLATLATDLAWESADYWRGEMATYGPDDGDGDGETDTLYGCDPDTDDEETPIVTIVPWDTDGGDDDRRRSEWDTWQDAYDAGYADGRAGDDCRLTIEDAYHDGLRAGAAELARVEAAALSCYDSWLTSGEWDALDQLTLAVGGPVSFDGRTAYVPAIRFVSPPHRDGWLYFHGLHRLPHTECVFGGGLAVRIKGAAQ